MQDRDYQYKEQNDLVWKLDAFKNKKLAAEFFDQVSEGICVYSADVEALYTNYSVDFCHGSQSLIVLPNPHASHDTLYDIRKNAVLPTGIYIVQKKKTFLLLIPLRDKATKQTRHKLFKFGEGIILIKKLLAGRQFIPVVQKGDLREHGSGYPKIHLHRLHEPEMTNLSGLDISSTRRVVANRFTSLVGLSEAKELVGSKETLKA